MESERSARIRLAAFKRTEELTALSPVVPWARIRAGFEFSGERIYLATRAQGIFKPRSMQYLLSIRTGMPKEGRRVWYDDQKDIHRRIFEGDGALEYDFKGTNPAAAENRYLREAWEDRIPILYFLAVAPAKYLVITHTYVVSWNPARLKAGIAFGDTALTVPQQAVPVPPTDLEQRYALRSVKQRLHQSLFRESLVEAYGGRCAVSGLPEVGLLEAAHIIEDRNQEFGQPVVPNGLLLSNLHHKAYDQNLLGVNADGRLHVSDRLLAREDGPLLETLKSLDGSRIRRPARRQDWPDRDRLAERYERFLKAA